MFGWDDANNNYQQVQNGDDSTSFGQEVLAGAASFGAMHEYEKYRQDNGHPENHGLAKEMIAGFAGAEVDKFGQHQWDNHEDREAAKQQAQQQAQQLYDQQYGDNGGSYDNGPNQYLQDQFGGYGN